MIHAVPSRMWYVNNFLIPSIQQQGEANIEIWNDENQDGNLKSFVKSMYKAAEEEGKGIWHLQDDVLLSKDFIETAKRLPDDKICNGITIEKGNSEFVGIQPVKNRWLSFQAIYIPTNYAKGFIDWWLFKVVKEELYIKRRAENKYDDYFFWKYMGDKHPNDVIINICPNIAQHIDYIIGGTTTNYNYKKMRRSYHWEEEAEEKELERRIKEWQKWADH